MSLIFLTPLLLRKLGDDAFGLLVVATTIMGLNGLFSLGLGPATQHFVAKYRQADSGKSKLTSVVETSLLTNVVFGVFSGLVIILFARVIPFFFNNVAEGNGEIILNIVQLAGVALPFVFVANTVDNSLRGFERFDLSVPLVALTRLTTAIVQIVLVLSGFQIFALVLAAVLLQVVQATIGLVVLRKSVLPELALIPRFSLEEFKAFVSYGIYVWLNSLIGTARNSGEILILVSILGPALLTLYVVPVRVLSQVHLLLTKAFAYLFPFATKLIQSGKTEEIYQVYSLATRYLCTLSGLAIASLAIGCGPLLSFWLTPPDADADAVNVAEKMVPVFQLLALRYAVFPLSILTSNLLMAANKTKAMTIIMAVNTITIVPISALAAYFFGVQGAAAAQLLVFAPILFNRYFVEKTLFGKARLETVIIPVLIASVPLACLLLTVRIPVDYELLPTILIAGLCGLLCGAICWFSSGRFFATSHFGTAKASQ